ncbi:FecR family protein [Bacteroidota bacterium]
MIDFYLIWKKIHNVLTEEENQILKNWLDANPLHKKILEQAEKHYTSEEYKTPFYTDPLQAWKILESKLNDTKKKRRRTLVYISGIAASILILVSFCFYFLNGSKYNETTELADNQIIKPGTNKATLILDDGTQFDLSDVNQFEKKEGNTTIKSEGTKIIYSEDQNKPAELKFNTLKIPKGGEFFLILSDSTKIWLNSQTELRYPVQFGDNKREVELIGEAFFEVKSDNQRPFHVISEDQIVKAIGTSFNISSYRNDSLVFTTLIEGIAEVYLKENTVQKKILYPNFQSYYYKNKDLISYRKINPYPFIAWKEGRFYFENQSLDEIMQTFSRWYNVEINFVRKETKRIKFTGDLRRYDNFEEVLSLINKTNEMKYEIKYEDNSPTVIIY